MLSAVIFYELSYSAMLLSKQPRHQRLHFIRSSRTRRCVSQFSTLTADRDRTVSRRSEPSSRTTLIGEQPNPWGPFQSQDVMSRHRGAKRSRRYGLSKTISLLSPAYLLFVER